MRNKKLHPILNERDKVAIAIARNASELIRYFITQAVPGGNPGKTPNRFTPQEIHVIVQEEFSKSTLLHDTRKVGLCQIYNVRKDYLKQMNNSTTHNRMRDKVHSFEQRVDAKLNKWRKDNE